MIPIRWSLLAKGPKKLWERALVNQDEALAHDLWRVKAFARDLDPNVIVKAFFNKPHHAVLRYALQSGLDHTPQYHYIHNKPLLHHAAGSGDMELLDMLLDAGAPIDVKNDMEYTPLHYALSRTLTWVDVPEKCDQVALRLLDRGACPKKPQGVHKNSYLASLGDMNIHMFQALIEKGVPTQWEDWHYRVLLNTSDAHAVQTLVGQKYALFELAPYFFNPQLEEHLVLLEKHGQNHTTKNTYGNNFLFECLNRLSIPDNIDEADAIKQAKQQLNMLERFSYKTTDVNDKGDTVWHIIVRCAKTSQFAYHLLKDTASHLLHQPNKSGQTPLDIVQAWPKEYNGHVFKALIEKHYIDQYMPVKPATIKKRKL